MKDEGWKMNDEWWMMKDADFKLLRGFEDRQTNEQTYIGDCRVTFVTENYADLNNLMQENKWWRYFLLNVCSLESLSALRIKIIHSSEKKQKYYREKKEIKRCDVGCYPCVSSQSVYYTLHIIAFIYISYTLYYILSA